MRIPTLLIIAVCTILLLGACSNTATLGRLPKNCSGVPGDLTQPDVPERRLSPTHGPGTEYLPLVVQAVAKPATSDSIPLLYVFDDKGNYVSSWKHNGALLDAPIFKKLENEAFWYEVSDGAGYQIPWLDRCAIASMLREPFPLKAPAGGLLFVQFVAPQCADCTEINTAIEAVLRKNPNLSATWVQIEVSHRVGRLHVNEH